MPPPLTGSGARRYPDTLPDSPTLGLESPPICVGDHPPPPNDHYHSDDYNSDFNSEDADGVADGDDDEAEDEDNADWHWQCHLCAHTNPLPRHYRSFASVPLSLSQPCGNASVPPREPTYSPAPPEDRSWEARMQGLDLPVGLSAYTGAGQGAAGRGTAGRGAAGIGTATAGVNYVGMPMSYAFSTADNTRAGPSTPVRFRGTGARAWPELGMAVAPKIVAAGRGSADFSACASGAGDPVPLVRTATGTDNGAGQARRCTHRRCEGCYDLDAEKRVVRFCGGSSVDPNQYARWYASFGFVDGIEPAVVDGGLKVRQRQWHRGADIPRLILEGVSNDEKQNADADSQGARPDYEGERLGDGVEYRGITETGEERFIAHGEEVLVSRYDASVSEMRRDGPSRPQPGKGIPVPYATGESRILPIQTSERSDGESQETRGSSDDGKESFGEMVGLERERQEHGQVDGDNGERSGSDVSQGWIEPIAFVHRGSQKGGGMSEIEEGADGDDENYDADEEKEEGPGQHR